MRSMISVSGLAESSIIFAAICTERGCLRQVRHQIFQACHIRLIPYEHTVISNGKRSYIRNLQSFEESRLIIGECRQHLVGCRYQNGRTGFIELSPQIILLGIIRPRNSTGYCQSTEQSCRNHPAMDKTSIYHLSSVEKSSFPSINTGLSCLPLFSMLRYILLSNEVFPLPSALRISFFFQRNHQLLLMANLVRYTHRFSALYTFICKEAQSI